MLRSYDARVRAFAIRAVTAAFVLVLGVGRSSNAAADNFFHPILNTRMAVTDMSTASGMQPWVWVASHGDASSAAMLLGKKADVADPSAWIFAFTDHLGTAPDAVSWTDGANARQRVFYGRNNGFEMLNWDNNTQNALETLPLAAGYTVPVGDVAAVTWVSGGTRRLAAAAYAARNGTAGYLCFWEKIATATSWSTSCTTSAVMPVLGAAPLPDIVGVVQGTTPLFFFRNANGRLGRARRTNVAAYTTEELGTTAIAYSVFAINSQTAGSVDVGVIRTTDNRVLVGRLAATTTLTPAWTTLPALPNGAVPWVGTSSSLSGAMYPRTSTSTRTEVQVINSTGRLHAIHTTDGTGNTWESAWSSAAVPGNSLPTWPDQVVYSLGASIGNAAANGARLFFTGGTAFGSLWASTLQEYMWGFPKPFMDHARFSWNYQGLNPVTTGATEASVGIGALTGVAAAIQRNSPAPWRIQMADTLDGGASFGTAVPVQPLYGSSFPFARSVSDPTAMHGGNGGRQLHFSTVEVSINPSGCGHVDGEDFITYRRGMTAADIASTSNTFWVDQGSGTLDHPGVAVTVNSSDQPTAHVMWWDVGAAKTMYWKMAPGDVRQGPYDLTAALPARPTAIVVGNYQRDVYGWTFNASGGWPKICKLNGSSTSLTCGTIGGGTATPTPTTRDIPFGNPVAQSAAGACSSIAGANGAAVWFKCFDTFQTVAVAADPAQSNKIHVAYQGNDPATGRLAIYYTQNTDGAMAVWQTPIKIASHATMDVFDPDITVDYEGTIVVSYSRMLRSTPSASSSGQAEVLVRWSNSGTTWFPEQQFSSWDADNLPFHCLRRTWFLGEYRYGDVVGSRAMHLLPFSSGGTGEPIQQLGIWFSRSYNLPR